MPAPAPSLKRYSRWRSWGEAYLLLAGLLNLLALSVLLFSIWISQFRDLEFTGTITFVVFLSLVHWIRFYAYRPRLSPSLPPPDNSRNLLRIFVEETARIHALPAPAHIRLQAESALFLHKTGPAMTLRMGLPQLMGLPLEALQALLQHELVRVHDPDGPGGRHTPRVEAFVLRRGEAMAMQGHGVLLYPYRKWFWPRIAEEARLLLQARVLHADAVCHPLLPGGRLPAALLQEMLLLRWVSRHWDRELAQLRLSSPTPPSDLPERRLACLQTPIPEALAHTWKLEALEMVALDGEMMPAFQDRLARMGAGPPSLPPPLRTPAAAALLTEDDLLEVLLVLGLREARMIRKDWKRAHQHLKDRADLIDPHQTAASIPHMWRAATLLAEGPEPTQALPWLEKIHQQDRDHKGARFLLGALKAEDHPQEAATWLRPLAANDFFYGSDAADLLLNLAALRGDTAEVQHLQQKLDPFFVRLADAVEERGKAPTRKTLFLDPMIPPDLRASMVKEIHQLGKIKEVLIVRTEVTEFPETPAYYVSIAYRGLVTRQQALEDKVLTCLQDHLPGTCRVLTSEEAGWRRRMRKSPGAALYNRRKEKAAQRQ